MECSRVRHILLSEAEGDLSEELRGQLRDHLEKCRSCSLQFQALSEQSELLRSLPRHEAPPAFLENVRRRVEAPRQSLFEHIRACLPAVMGSRPLFRFAATAAVAIVVLTSARHVLRESSVEHGVLVIPTPPAPATPGTPSAPSDAFVDNRTSDDRTGMDESNTRHSTQAGERAASVPFADRPSVSLPSSAGGANQPGVLPGPAPGNMRQPTEQETANRAAESSRLGNVAPRRPLLQKQAAPLPSAETTGRMQAGKTSQSPAKEGPTESKSFARGGSSAATGIAPTSAPPAARPGLADNSVQSRPSAEVGSRQKQPMPALAPPIPSPASQPSPLSPGARTHEVSLTLTLDPPDNSVRGELKSPAASQQRMKDSRDLSFSKAVRPSQSVLSPGQDAQAPTLEEPSKPATGADLLRQRMSSIRSAVLQAKGTIVSDKPDTGSTAPSVLVLEIPAQNYPAFIAQLRTFGGTELKSGEHAPFPPDSIVRVTVTLSLPRAEKK
ncbi:MAG: hypothetical protein ABFD97_03415 [Syntrophobacter sp.]